MFLDDEVLLMCKDSEINTPEQVQKLYADVCEKFDSYRRSNMNALMSSRELRSVINKTFNLWDSTVRMCLKSTDSKLNIIGGMLEKYSYKKTFLKDSEMKRIYDSL